MIKKFNFENIFLAMLFALAVVIVIIFYNIYLEIQ